MVSEVSFSRWGAITNLLLGLTLPYRLRTYGAVRCDVASPDVFIRVTMNTGKENEIESNQTSAKAEKVMVSHANANSYFLLVLHAA